MSPLSYLCGELLSHGWVPRTPWPGRSTHAPLYILRTQDAHDCLLQPD